MYKRIDPFLYNVPELNIHGMDRITAKIEIEIFIDNQLRIGNKKLIIIHGKGEGILKKETQNILKNNRKVLEYKINNYNDGETIVILK